MLEQTINQTLAPILDIAIEASEPISDKTKEEVLGLVEKLFRYGKHIEGDKNTYHIENLLITKGESRNRTVSWMQIDLVDSKKVQRNLVQRNKLFYCDRQLGETSWFVSYFHSGSWIVDLEKIVSTFEGKCFKG